MLIKRKFIAVSYIRPLNLTLISIIHQQDIEAMEDDSVTTQNSSNKAVDTKDLNPLIISGSITRRGRFTQGQN